MKKFLIFGGLVLLVGVILMVWIGSHTAPLLKAEFEELISQRTGRVVKIESFSWSVWPALSFQGNGLQVGSGEEKEELFVLIDSLSIRGTLIGLFSSPRQLSSLSIESMHIRVPPRRDGASESPVSLQPRKAEGTGAPFLISEILVKKAFIELVPKQINRTPRTIQIHEVKLLGFAFDRQSPFQAKLTYPHPEGDVQVDGEFGPFNRRNPAETPISGDYLYQDADLSNLREVGGILDSKGRFEGNLSENRIDGEATVPDFYLQRAQNRVPFKASYTVTRQAGDIILNRVECKIVESELTARGRIFGDPAQKGRVIDIHVITGEAQIEDLLTLALEGEKPPLIGPLQLETDVKIPPGQGRVIERIKVQGVFRIREGEFTDKGFQEKLAQVSQFGSRQESGNEDTFSEMSGDFTLDSGLLEFHSLRFGVPGMIVRLQGTYDLPSEEMNLVGRVNLEKSVSEMTSGRLSEWLRLADPIFRGSEGGTSVPIRITGNRSNPSVALDF